MVVVWEFYVFGRNRGCCVGILCVGKEPWMLCKNFVCWVGTVDVV